MIENIKEILKKIKKALFIISILLFNLNTMVPVYAADDPLTVINNLTDFIFLLTKGVGTIIVIFGIIQIGISIQSHDPSQRTSGIFTFLGGLIITFSKEILNILTK